MSEHEESAATRDSSFQTFKIDETIEDDSNYSPSGNSALASSSQETSSARGRSRKRKIQKDLASSNSRVKRLKFSYNDKYRQLFNETLEDIINDTVYESELPPSQIGVSIWSPEEKECFFASLTKRGRLDVQSVAFEIGSKSESEVTIYLEKLQNAVNEEENYEVDPKKLLRVDKIDAAVEIGKTCCASLDIAAEALSLLQQKEEEKLERKKYRHYAILTDHIAKDVDRSLYEGESNEHVTLDTVPAATLLNLKAFLALSKRFFMNSSVIESNWRNYAERQNKPSIMYTAFSDFHNLTLSLTKRLVQSSLFLAMSRMRATTLAGNRKPGPHVRRRDVVAALDVLGLQHNSMKTWAGTARKCRLRVFENVRYRQVSGKRYDYDEVEEALSFNNQKNRARSVSRTTDKFANSTTEPSEGETSLPTDDIEDSKSEDSNSNATNPSDHDLSSDHRDKTLRKRKDPKEAQDFYAEALDQRASQKEEYRLWELLGEDPNTKMDAQKLTLPKVPASTRKSQDELIDWKDYVDYAAEWETFGAPLPASAFAENWNRKRKGTKIAAGLSESEPKSDGGEDEGSSSQISVEGSRSLGASARDGSVDSDASEDGGKPETLRSKGEDQVVQDMGDDDDVVEESSEEDVVNDGSP